MELKRIADISVLVYMLASIYIKKVQDRTETVLLLPKKLADKSLPQHFLGFSVRTNQDRGVATRILFSSNVTSKYTLLLVCKYVPFPLA